MKSFFFKVSFLCIFIHWFREKY